MGKRGNGEGTISRRKNGGWMAQYYVHTAEGRKRKTIYGKTRAGGGEEAHQGDLRPRERTYLRRRGPQARRVPLPLAGRLRDGHGAEHHLRALRADLTDPHHPDAGRRQAQGPVPDPRAWPLQGEASRRACAPAPCSTSTSRSTRRSSRPSTDGLIPRNATEAVKPPQVRREEMRPLDRGAGQAATRAARGDRLEALYVLAVHTGLRQGELLGLKWEDVDLGVGISSASSAP